ncbi:Uncharacterised protein [Mycolicibacterium smegmatis]|nr:Uncharacterised protein [Mycolicibacterium smegmatis]
MSPRQPVSQTAPHQTRTAAAAPSGPPAHPPNPQTPPQDLPAPKTEPPEPTTQPNPQRPSTASPPPEPKAPQREQHYPVSPSAAEKPAVQMSPVRHQRSNQRSNHEKSPTAHQPMSTTATAEGRRPPVHRHCWACPHCPNRPASSTPESAARPNPNRLAPTASSEHRHYQGCLPTPETKQTNHRHHSRAVLLVLEGHPRLTASHDHVCHLVWVWPLHLGWWFGWVILVDLPR